MRRRDLVTLAGVATVVAAASLAVAKPTPPRVGVGRALLIGVNAYAELPPLRGARNDVERLRALLLTRYGFDERHVRVLTDEAATRAGILAALSRLVDEAGPNDAVYIHFSGHGSQVRDLDGDEDDGLDETICPQDARRPGVPDITDDELAALVGRLEAGSAVIVLDSCHSGTALRGDELGLRARFVAPDEREELYPRPSRRVVTLPLSERYLLFTGAAAEQSALDGPFDGDRYCGLFSYALSQSLASAPADASAREILRGVERQLEKLRPRLGGRSAPEPQLEAPRPLLDRPLFASRASSGR